MTGDRSSSLHVRRRNPQGGQDETGCSTDYIPAGGCLIYAQQPCLYTSFPSHPWMACNVQPQHIDLLTMAKEEKRALLLLCDMCHFSSSHTHIALGRPLLIRGSAKDHPQIYQRQVYESCRIGITLSWLFYFCAASMSLPSPPFPSSN